MSHRVRVAVLDVGAHQNLGWAAIDAVRVGDCGPWRAVPTDASRDHGASLADLVTCVGHALDGGLLVALGFECPSFVPVRHHEQELLKQRRGEAGAPFAAGAGALATVAGLVESAWVLDRVAAWGRRATVDPASWSMSDPLLLWEAFVSNAGKEGADRRAVPPSFLSSTNDRHVLDAATASTAFIRRGTPSISGTDVSSGGEPAFNLPAAAALRAGLTANPAELRRRSYVVKAAP